MYVTWIIRMTSEHDLHFEVQLLWWVCQKESYDVFQDAQQSAGIAVLECENDLLIKIVLRGLETLIESSYFILI